MTEEAPHQKLVVDGQQTDSAQGARKLLKMMRQQKRLGRGKTSINLHVSKTIKPINEDEQKQQQERILNRTLKKVVVNEQNNIAPIVRTRKKKIQFTDKNDLSFKDLKDKFKTEKPGENEEKKKVVNPEYEAVRKEYDGYKYNQENEINDHIRNENELKGQFEFLTAKIYELTNDIAKLKNDGFKIEIEELNEKIKQQEINFNEQITNKTNENNELTTKNENLEKEIEDLKNNPPKIDEEETKKEIEDAKQQLIEQTKQQIKQQYMDEVERLNCEMAMIKVENLNKQFENESLINKYKNIIISVKKKYKIKKLDI